MVEAKGHSRFYGGRTPSDLHIRRARSDRFKTAVISLVGSDFVRVISVFREARNPEGWKRRLPAE